MQNFKFNKNEFTTLDPQSDNINNIDKVYNITKENLEKSKRAINSKFDKFLSYRIKSAKSSGTSSLSGMKSKSSDRPHIDQLKKHKKFISDQSSQISLNKPNDKKSISPRGNNVRNNTPSEIPSNRTQTMSIQSEVISESQIELREKIKHLSRNVESKDRYIKKLKEMNNDLHKKLEENKTIIQSVTNSESKLKSKLISLLNSGMGMEKVDIKEVALDLKTTELKNTLEMVWNTVRHFDGMINFTKKIFDIYNQNNPSEKIDFDSKVNSNNSPNKNNKSKQDNNKSNKVYNNNRDNVFDIIKNLSPNEYNNKESQDIEAEDNIAVENKTVEITKSEDTKEENISYNQNDNDNDSPTKHKFEEIGSEEKQNNTFTEFDSSTIEVSKSEVKLQQEHNPKETEEEMDVLI